MKIVCLQHVPFETPGYLETWFARKNAQMRTVLLPKESLPNPKEYDAVVVMGGPMNIYQHRDHPWLITEKAFIKQCLDREVPILGICLGAQLLADALGSRVFQNTHREIGWFPIRLTSEIRTEFPTLPAEANVLHWHGDTFELPEKAIRIATSEACPEQGFYIPHRCLALQFHIEAPNKSVKLLLENCPDDLAPGSFVQTYDEIAGGSCESAFQYLEPLLTGIFKTW